MSREYPERPIPCVAAVTLRGDEVLLIRRAFEPRRGIWTFPGGGVEVGETAREACAREVLEEAGIRISVGPVIDVADVMQPDGRRWRYHYTILDFLAAPYDPAEEATPGSDAADARWVNVNDIGKYQLTPVALHVLHRGLWMRDHRGPEHTGDTRTLF